MSLLELEKMTRLAGRLAAYRKGHHLSEWERVEPCQRWKAKCTKCGAKCVAYVSQGAGGVVGTALDEDCEKRDNSLDFRTNPRYIDTASTEQTGGQPDDRQSK